jgi:hypothetical protein
VIALGVVLGGCAGSQQNAMTADDQSYTPPTSVYGTMDSTALVYTDPAAASQVNDHVLRWVGFVMHPVGQVFDYAVNRPLYLLAHYFPYLMGYTSEDAMVDTQRKNP